MFTGLFTKILVGVIGALLLTNAITYVKYNWFDKPAFERQITDLQNKNVELTIEKEKARVEADQAKKALAVKERVTREQRQVDAIVGSGDAAGAVNFFRELREKGRLSTPADAGKGRP